MVTVHRQDQDCTASSGSASDRDDVSEETPLLRKRDTIVTHDQVTEDDDELQPNTELDPELGAMLDEDETSTTKLILYEFWVLGKGAVPVVFTYALQQSMPAVAVAIVGRSSPQDLSTAAFAFLFVSATAWIIGLGGTTALDTLASSSFTGSRNKHDLGVLLQRSFLVLGLLYVPIMILSFFSKPLFLALGQTERLATDSARFVIYLNPCNLGFIYFEAIKKYLQAQNIMRPGSYIMVPILPLTALLNYLFVYTFGWGLYSSPFATALGYWLAFFGLVLYIRFVDGYQCWGGWSKRCLRNLWPFTKLAIFGTIQIGAEWWAFEIVAIAAGWFGETSIAAQSIIGTVDQVINTIPFGISVVASVRVGNMLGAQNAQGAARAAHVAAFFGAFCGSIVLVILMCTRHVFGKMFNNDPDVVSLTAKTLPFVALFQIADGLNGPCGGVLRGMGRQNVAAAVGLVAYYAFSLPLGIYLAYHGWGLPGLWLGQCIALYTSGVGVWTLVTITKWKQQVENALARIENGED